MMKRISEKADKNSIPDARAECRRRSEMEVIAKPLFVPIRM